MNEQQGLPEELESMTPGPELATLLAAVDRTTLSGGDRLRLARARNRLASHVQAQLMEDLYAITWEEPPADSKFDPNQASRYPWAETECAFALRWTRTAAGSRLEQARQLIEDLPQVQQALSEGRIDMPKALVIADLTSWLGGENPDAVARLVDKIIDKAERWTTGQLRARLRQLILAIDPQAATRRTAAAIKSRRVEVFDNEDGTGEIWGRSLPPQDTAAVRERLTAIARAAKSAGDSRSMAQLRVDAFLDLLIGDGVAVGEPITPHTGGLPEAAGLPDDELLFRDTSPPGTPGERAQEKASTDPATGTAGDADTAGDTDIPGDADTAGEGDTAPDVDTDRGSGVDGAVGDAGAAGQTPAAATEATATSTSTTAVEATSTGPTNPNGTTAATAGGGQPDGRWDPAWPAEPWEPIGAHHLHPDPAGEPVNQWDDDGHGFDGPDLWPPDWPGRWHDDPAVAAAKQASHSPLGLPAGGSGTPLCRQCSRPAAGLPAPRRGVVELQVPLSTAIGLDDLPGELNGYGPVVADIARQVIAQMPEAQWRFSAYNRLGELAVHSILATRPVRNPDTGHGGQRRPTAEQAAFVRARDRRCVAPGCRRPARGCDIDHTLAWVKGGKTLTCNLEVLCRAHHLFKHTTGCELTQLSPGVFVWQTPRGLQYLTKPDPPLLDASAFRNPG